MHAHYDNGVRLQELAERPFAIPDQVDVDVSLNGGFLGERSEAALSEGEQRRRMIERKRVRNYFQNQKTDVRRQIIRELRGGFEGLERLRNGCVQDDHLHGGLPGDD